MMWSVFGVFWIAVVSCEVYRRKAAVFYLSWHQQIFKYRLNRFKMADLKFLKLHNLQIYHVLFYFPDNVLS